MQDGVLGQEGDRLFVLVVSQVSVNEGCDSQLQFAVASCDGLAEHTSGFQHGGVSVPFLHRIEVSVTLSQGAGTSPVEGGRTAPQLPVDFSSPFHADLTTPSSRIAV